MTKHIESESIETSTNFTPQFDQNGLIPCIVTSASTGNVLMMAYMNAQALEKTITTQEAHYWSRSRKELWHKGATSGSIQKVTFIRTDCDQDCLWIGVDIQENPNSTCHTNRKTCFYRELKIETKNKYLQFRDA